MSTALAAEPVRVFVGGTFDGLHRGHLKIIERVKRGAAEHGGTPMAMTFDPHPPRVVRPDKAPPLLMTKEQRLEALHRAGIACVAVVRFTPELSQWDPETFVRRVLVEWLRISKLWVGANFLFGHGRSGRDTGGVEQDAILAHDSARSPREIDQHVDDELVDRALRGKPDVRLPVGALIDAQRNAAHHVVVLKPGLLVRGRRRKPR